MILINVESLSLSLKGREPVSIANNITADDHSSHFKL